MEFPVYANGHAHFYKFSGFRLLSEAKHVNARMSGTGCVVCECPVADGGVAVSEINADTMSSWWVSTRCRPKLFPPEAVVCQFCAFDARFAYEYMDSDVKQEDFAWWRHNFDHYGYKYYQACMMKRCCVKISKMDEEKEPSKKCFRLDKPIKKELGDSTTKKDAATQTVILDEKSFQAATETTARRSERIRKNLKKVNPSPPVSTSSSSDEELLAPLAIRRKRMWLSDSSSSASSSEEDHSRKNRCLEQQLVEARAEIARLRAKVTFDPPFWAAPPNPAPLFIAPAANSSCVPTERNVTFRFRRSVVPDARSLPSGPPPPGCSDF